MPTVLVFAEARDGKLNKAGLEAITAAKALGVGDVVAIALGNQLDDQLKALGKYGATKVLYGDSAVFNPYTAEGYARAIIKQASQIGDLAAVIVPATAMGKDLAPRIAAGLSAPYAADCVEIINNGGTIEARRPVYAGKASVTVKPTGGALVASLRPNSVKATESGGGDAALETFEADTANLRDLVKEIVRGAQGKLDVAEADIIVSGGRGLGSPEQFEKLIPPVAAALGAAIGASRAVVDAGWRPHGEQVGQTGKTVSPQLYIACGISGAVQHLAGMGSAKCIVAINKDPEAPIFKVADYGIVGTVEDCLPALAEEIKKVRGG